MVTRISQTMSRAAAAVIFALASSTILVEEASATTVSISGTHSKGEIKKACGAVGGMSIEGQGGVGYGCFNPNKNTTVACNNKGVCTGYVPHQTPGTPRQPATMAVGGATAPQK